MDSKLADLGVAMLIIAVKMIFVK